MYDTYISYVNMHDNMYDSVCIEKWAPFSFPVTPGVMRTTETPPHPQP